MTVDKFVKKMLPNLYKKNFWFLRPQYDFMYDDDGRCLVDFIGKFENLNADFSKVTQHLGLESNQLPHKNISKSSSNFKRKSNHIKQDFKFIQPLLPSTHSTSNKLSNDSIAIVKDHYYKDLKYFGFK